MSGPVEAHSEQPSGPPLVLRRREERRVLRGHPWIFANEIESDLKAWQPGDLVDVVDHQGRPVGRGTCNPQALIAVRLFSRRGEAAAGPDAATLTCRIADADRFRHGVLSPLPPAYRVVHGEADRIPGLVVDRYGDVLAVQALTAGMRRRLDLVLSVLAARFSPRAVVLRNDTPMVEMEGLEQEAAVVSGELTAPVRIEEAPAPGAAPLALDIDPLRGQKTGAFLDQRANLAAVAPLLAGADVLDLFCHEGWWSLGAARLGAGRVLGVDVSAQALERATAAAHRNGLGEKCEFTCGEAFETLRGLAAAGRRFDMVFCDPPAFVKRKARLAEGLKGYVAVNRRAMERVREGGWLVTSTCSHHVDREAFRKVLATAAAEAHRTLRVASWLGARADHPTSPAVPETDYLACVVAQVL